MSHQHDSMITDLFVYGTLKRGECREFMWPRKPIKIRSAYILARLYDLEAYPAIRVDETEHENAGESFDWVQGELWSFDRKDIAATIIALDEIEETNQRGRPNLYDHVLVRAHDQPVSKDSALALVYQYSDARRLAYSRRLRPREGVGFVSWSANAEASGD